MARDRLNENKKKTKPTRAMMEAVMMAYGAYSGASSADMKKTKAAMTSASEVSKLFGELHSTGGLFPWTEMGAPSEVSKDGDERDGNDEEEEHGDDEIDGGGGDDDDDDDDDDDTEALGLLLGDAVNAGGEAAVALVEEIGDAAVVSEVVTAVLSKLRKNPTARVFMDM